MKRKPILAAYVLLLTLTALSTHAQSPPNAKASAERAMLRVVCDDASVNAEITINGEFKGECPVDIQVPAGAIKLRAFKKVDASSDRSFEQEFRMAADTVKRVTVELGPTQLNAQGQKLQEERKKQQEAMAAQRAAEERRLAEEKEQRETEAREVVLRAAAAVQSALEQKAQAGDIEAMLTLAEKSNAAQPEGVSTPAATEWYMRAIAFGSPYAQFLLSDLYRSNHADSGAQALLKVLRRPAPAERSVDIQGAEAIRQFVATDAFFAASGAGASHYRRTVSDSVTHHRVCTGQGRLFDFEGVVNIKNAGLGSRDHSVTGTAALGGLLFLQWKSSRFFESSEIVATEILTVAGQPFPLDATRRFSLSFKTHEKSASWNVDRTHALALNCGVDPTRSSSMQNARIMACLVSKDARPVGYLDLHVMSTGCARFGATRGDLAGLVD